MNLKDALFYFDFDYEVHDDVNFADYCKEPDESGQQELDHLYDALIALDDFRANITKALDVMDLNDSGRYMKLLNNYLKPLTKSYKQIDERVEEIIDFDYIEYEEAIKRAHEQDKQEARAYRQMVRNKGV